MPEEEAPEKPSNSATEVISAASSSAEATRKAATWIAGGLGSIPGLAVLAALVRAPGKAGFEPVPLLLGIVLAAIGAVLGIYAFGHVLAPVEVSDQALETDEFDISRVPGHRFGNYQKLRDSLGRVGEVYASGAVKASDAQVAAKRAEARLALVQAELKTAEEALAEKPKDEARKAKVEAARRNHDAERASALETAGNAAARVESQTFLAGQLASRERIRSEAFLLYGADEVARRYNSARILAAAAAGFIAVGVFFLAIAPRPESEGVTPTLVSLTLTEEGKQALGCSLGSLQGIRVGGDDETPLVITLPEAACPAKLVKFHTGEPTVLGSFESEKPVEPPAPLVSPT